MTTEPLPRARSRPAYDVLVVGGGPAGLSAAVALARSLRSVLVVDAGRPRNATASGVHNYLGREVVPPADLLDGRSALTSSLRRRGRATGEVTPSRRAMTRFRGRRSARTAAAEARRVVVATGLTDACRRPRARARWGRDVLHCPYCHGYEARGTAIGILSTEPMTAHQALMFRQWTRRPGAVHRTPRPPLTPEQSEQLAARDIRVVDRSGRRGWRRPAGG